MSECKFEHVIVIGYGVIAGEVLRTVHEMAPIKGYTDEYVEHEVHPFNSAKKYAEAEHIECHVIENSQDLLAHFWKAVIKKTLIISASNNYLFPAELIANSNITIINFHNALLPELPGRNAPSWAIYEDRKSTGVTWHYVTAGVDAGDIIIQKKCDIEEDIKAYELTARLMKMASEAFDECYESVLCNTAKVSKQNILGKRRLYKSYEIPAGGRFELTSSPKDIYRLLRAMDYGKNDIFPAPVTQMGDDVIRIRRYQKVGSCEVKQGQQDRIYLPLNDEYYLMLKYDVIESDGRIRGGRQGDW